MKFIVCVACVGKSGPHSNYVEAITVDASGETAAYKAALKKAEEDGHDVRYFTMVAQMAGG